jgi:Uri superfamily endonuclease
MNKVKYDFLTVSYRFLSSIGAEILSETKQAAMKKPVILLGDETQRGTYILRIQLAGTLAQPFGRFMGGKIIPVPAGMYVYVGSALGERGATTLPRRLMRHATRSASRPPHHIRDTLLETFRAAGLGSDNLLPRSPKKLFWNIDHLLDQAAAEITHVIAIRYDRRLETIIAGMLEDDPETRILEKGLGANDTPGSTHLLRVEARTVCWWSLAEMIRGKLNRDFATESE